MTLPLDTFFLLLVLLSGIAALAAKDLLAAAIAFGAFSFFSAMFFASLGALDVSFTEAAVGVITTVLLVTVLYRTGPREAPAGRAGTGLSSVLAALVLALAGAVLLRATGALPAVGDAGSPASRHVSPRYIEQGPGETGASNMVTGVLADYRSYDTLGETVVIFTAGLVCLLLLGAPERARGEDAP